MKKKYVIISLVVLICVVSVACFFLFEDSTMQDRYLEECNRNGFSLYPQEAGEDSSVGLVNGFISTSQNTNIQFDFYEFTNEEYAIQAYKRVVGWVLVHHGDRSMASGSQDGTDWSLQTEKMYFRVVRQGNCVTYIICTDLRHVNQAKTIFTNVVEE